MQGLKDFFDDLAAGKPYAETVVRLSAIALIVVLWIVIPQSKIEQGLRFLFSDRVITFLGINDRVDVEEPGLKINEPISEEESLTQEPLTDLPPTLPATRQTTRVDALSDPTDLPEGTILFAKGDQLQLLELQSGKKTLIPLADDRATLTGFDSSPDDSTIVYSLTRSRGEYDQALGGELYLYNTTTRQSTQLTDSTDVQNRYPVFSKDGKSVYFLQRKFNPKQGVLDDGVIVKLDLTTKKTQIVLTPKFKLSEDDLTSDRSYDEDGNFTGYTCLSTAEIYSNKIGIIGLEPTNDLIRYWEPYFGPECSGLWTSDHYASTDGTPAKLPSNQLLFGDEYAGENDFSQLSNSYFFQPDGTIIATRSGIYEDYHWSVLFDPKTQTSSRRTALDPNDDGRWMDFYTKDGQTISGLFALQDRENYQHYWYAQTFAPGEDLKPNPSQSVLLHMDLQNNQTSKDGYHPQHVFLSERYLLTTTAPDRSSDPSLVNELLLHDLTNTETVVLDADTYYPINLEPAPVN